MARALAEDLVAEAFARAWASWPKVSRHPAPAAWVVRTALNTRVSWWRRRRREVALDGHDRALSPDEDAAGQAAAPPAAGTSTPAKTVPVGWTLSKASDSQVKPALNGEQILDPDALQRALDEAGIHAVIRTRVLCTPKDAELPEANAVYRTAVESPDYQYAFIITPAKMPAGSRLYFSIFNQLGGKKLAKVAVALVPNDDPMICKQLR